jgi:thiol-disulfide isomerase/thioredoxin
LQTKSGVFIAVIALVIAIAAGILFRFGEPAASAPRLVGQVQNFVLTQERVSAPAEAWTDADGAMVSLGDFQDKVVLLNFWATWCGPCVRELPSINELQAKLGGDDFEVIALNIDRGGAAVAKPMVERLKLDRLKLHLDPESRLPRELGVRVMPTTIVYDRTGRELGRLQGAAEWNSPEALALISYFVDNPDFPDR